MDSFLQNSAVKALLPVPKDVAGEAKRAAKYLAKVAQVGEWSGVANKISDKFVIPPSIINNARGIAVFKVLKGGFIWSGRIGSGLCVARLPDGSWSAPAVFGMAGVGVGGQVGAQQTYLVLILNTDSGVKAFSSPGNVTLGADIGVSAGPIGREGSVSGAVVGLAPIYSYSKTQGLFVGVSLEGTIIFERRDANSKFYGQRISASDILRGKVMQPAEAKPLYNAIAAITNGDLSSIMGLDARQPGRHDDDDSDDDGPPPPPGRRSGGGSSSRDAPVGRAGSYLDSPVSSRASNDGPPPVVGRSPAAAASAVSRTPSGPNVGRSLSNSAAARSAAGAAAAAGAAGLARSASSASSARAPPAYTPGAHGGVRDEDRDLKTPAYTSIAAAAAARAGGGGAGQGSRVQGHERAASGKKPAPPPPKKPDALRSAKDMVTAVFPFEAIQPGDLDLEPGQTYEIIERTPTVDGWWKGRNPRTGKEGVFPGNYVKDGK